MWVFFFYLNWQINNMIFINPSCITSSIHSLLYNLQGKLKIENSKYRKQKQGRGLCIHVFPILIFIILCHMNCCELLFPLTCFHKTTINWHMLLVLGSEMKHLRMAHQLLYRCHSLVSGGWLFTNNGGIYQNTEISEIIQIYFKILCNIMV